MSTSSTAPRSRRSTEARTALATFVGTTIEWYDFFLFGTAAALVFPTVFFPDASPEMGLLASFATFWVGFIARPIGGLIFGHLGDRFGRKGALVTTLLITGIATALIGALPTYATVGAAAPILLAVLRAAQGLGLGGEWGGAVTLATESAPRSRRALAGMWVQQGSPTGTILATLAFLIVGQLPNDAFLAWGWRIPFLFSAVLVVVALVVRLTLEETPEYTKLRTQSAVVKLPLVEVFRIAPKAVFLGIGASALGMAAAYFVNTFALAWTTTILEVPRQTVLNVLLAVAFVQFVAQPLGAIIAHRIGMTKLMVGALIGGLIVVVPAYLLVATAVPLAIGLGLSLFALTSGAYFAVLAGFLASGFPAAVRYSGLSISYQLCATIVGGATPILCQALLVAFGNAIWGVVGYHLLLTVITLVCVIAMSRLSARTTDRDPEAAEAAAAVV